MPRWKTPGWAKRVAYWAVAIVALIFVARAVPIRDACIDPDAAPGAARVTVSREGTTCVLHRSDGDVALPPLRCAKLSCEPGLRTTFMTANVGLVALFETIAFLGTLAWAWRWRALVDLAKIKVPLLEVWRVTLEGMAAGLILPGGIGGDAVRIGAMVGRGAPTATMVASVLLDRASGLVSIALLASLLSFFYGHSEGAVSAISLGAIPLGYAAVLLVLRVPALARMKLLETGVLSRTIKPILVYLGDEGAPRAILRSLARAALTSALQLVVVRGMVYALGVAPTEERWIYIGYVLSLLVFALPSTPGAWGTGDAAFVVFFGRAGIPPATALALGLLIRLNAYVSGAVGAVLFMRRSGRAAAPHIRP